MPTFSILRRLAHAALRRALPVVLTVALGAGPSAAFYPAAAQGAVKARHGDWQIRCDNPPGAQSEQCALVQNVTAEDRPNVGLSIIALKTADNQSRVLRVLAPLGVLLPSGLGLIIDKADIGRAPFVRCLPHGCVAEVVLENELFMKLRSGKSAMFTVFETPEEGIGIPVSLAGFAPGFDALGPASK